MRVRARGELGGAGTPAVPGWGSVTLSLSARLRCRHALGLRALITAGRVPQFSIHAHPHGDGRASVNIFWFCERRRGCGLRQAHDGRDSRVDMLHVRRYCRCYVAMILFCVRLFRWNCKNDGRHRCTCSQPQHTAHIFLTLLATSHMHFAALAVSFFGRSLGQRPQTCIRINSVSSLSYRSALSCSG